MSTLKGAYQNSFTGNDPGFISQMLLSISLYVYYENSKLCNLSLTALSQSLFFNNFWTI